MEKTCSNCRGFHTAPFGIRCKHIPCASCGHRHLVTLPCTQTVSLPTPTISKPIIEGFEDRSDPKYLQYLEDSFLKQAEPDKSEMDLIRRRLLVLESRHTSPPPPGGAGGALGGALGGGFVAGSGGAVGIGAKSASESQAV